MFVVLADERRQTTTSKLLERVFENSSDKKLVKPGSRRAGGVKRDAITIERREGHTTEQLPIRIFNTQAVAITGEPFIATDGRVDEGEDAIGVADNKASHISQLYNNATHL